MPPPKSPPLCSRMLFVSWRLDRGLQLDAADALPHARSDPDAVDARRGERPLAYAVVVFAATVSPAPLEHRVRCVDAGERPGRRQRGGPGALVVVEERAVDDRAQDAEARVLGRWPAGSTVPTVPPGPRPWSVSGFHMSTFSR